MQGYILDRRLGLIQAKSDEIKLLIEAWAKENNVLKPGEQIEFMMSVVRLPTVRQGNSRLLTTVMSELHFSVRSARLALLACSRVTFGNTFWRDAERQMTLDDFLQVSSHDLLKLHGCGTGTVEEIRTKLAEIRCKFKGD